MKLKRAQSSIVRSLIHSGELHWIDGDFAATAAARFFAVVLRYDLDWNRPAESHGGNVKIQTTSAALVALIALGTLAGCASSPDEPVGESVVAATPTPTAEASGSDIPAAESLEIPAGLTPDEFAEAYFAEGITNWTKAGATKENELEWVATDDSAGFLRSLSEANAEVFASALLVPGWREVPTLAAYVEAMTKGNNSFLELYFKTDLLEQEPFSYTFTVAPTTVDESSGQKVFSTAVTEHTNAAVNRAGEIAPVYIDIDGRTSTFVYTTEIVNGTEKLSSLDPR